MAEAVMQKTNAESAIKRGVAKGQGEDIRV